MTKLVAFVLAALMIFTFVSCGTTGDHETTAGTSESTESTTASETTGTDSSETTNEETTSPEETTGDTSEEIAGTIPELIDQIYEKYPVSAGMSTTEIDITDADILKYQTGIVSGSKIEEAFLSGPIFSSTAYALVAVRVKNAADAESIAEEMQKNADPGKWICAYAESVQIAVSGNIILMAMTSEEEATGLIDAFTTLCGGKLDLFLEQ